MFNAWEYERVEHDNGRIVYEIHDPELEKKLEDSDMPDSTFIVIEGADARALAGEICAMLNRRVLKRKSTAHRGIRIVTGKHSEFEEIANYLLEAGVFVG